MKNLNSNMHLCRLGLHILVYASFLNERSGWRRPPSERSAFQYIPIRLETAAIDIIVLIARFPRETLMGNHAVPWCSMGGRGARHESPWDVSPDIKISLHYTLGNLNRSRGIPWEHHGLPREYREASRGFPEEFPRVRTGVPAGLPMGSQGFRSTYVVNVTPAFMPDT